MLLVLMAHQTRRADVHRFVWKGCRRWHAALCRRDARVRPTGVKARVHSARCLSLARLCFVVACCSVLDRRPRGMPRDVLIAMLPTFQMCMGNAGARLLGSA